MSDSSVHHSGKSVASSPTLIYQFHANSEELEEIQEKSLHKVNNTKDDVTTKSEISSLDKLDSTKNEMGKTELPSEMVQDKWNFLGRRSISVDSSYESPFSNPIESWRKLNELKGKITKTVEEKISEMKMDRYILGKSHSKLMSSKENSSISDSEDTSESSKLSEHLREAEDLNLCLKEVINKSTDFLSTSMENSKPLNVRVDIDEKSELKNRKEHAKLSDLMDISHIKIVTAKSEPDDGSLLDDSIPEDVESGVEADESLDRADSSTSIDFSDEPFLNFGDGSHTPPGRDLLFRLVSSFSLTILTETYTLAFLIGFGLYFCLPMSDFIRGFVTCLFFIFCFGIAKNYLCKEEISLQQEAKVISQPYKVSEQKSAKSVWVNEYEHEFYDPEYYSVTQTVPAYLELENSTLKLSRPKGKIRRRATCDEPEYKLQFVNQRVYNIAGCNVFLIPDGLTRKRLYSKKYPIVIFLKPDSFISEKGTHHSEEKENFDTTIAKDTNHKSMNSKRKSNLYLFARCDRQKEEWYRKLSEASRLTPTTIQNKKMSEMDEEKESVNGSPKRDDATPFENLFFDPDATGIEEYLRFMAKYVSLENLTSISSKVKGAKSHDSHIWNKKSKKKKNVKLDGKEDNFHRLESVIIDPNCEKSTVLEESSNINGLYSGITIKDKNEYTSIQVQWLNAFLNRILFDVFRSPLWLSRIHDKLHKKLNSIRLPYYIEDIEVIEMDLGKTGPTFQRVSQPHLDDRGLWFDMDLTFEGRIKITLQTYLNLVKLQKGMEEEQALREAREKSKNEKGKKKAKEPKDLFAVKNSNEKSKETVNRTNKKLEKRVPYPAARNHHESIPEEQEEPESSEINLQSVNESSKLQLYKEMAKLAEIAIEEGIKQIPIKEQDLVDDGSRDESLLLSDSSKIQTDRLAIYDSDLEDSAESSDFEEEEEEEEVVAPVQPTSELVQQPVNSYIRRYPKNRRSSQKIFRIFENLAQSRYFKSMAQSRYFQRAIAGVSATKLRLSLEVKGLTGTMSVNIPPPPSDRLWFGFRGMPKIILSASPMIGDKAVGFSQMKNYLQKKIFHEIKKILVLPNMIDFVLPTSEIGRSSSSKVPEPSQESPEPEKERTPS